MNPTSTYSTDTNSTPTSIVVRDTSSLFSSLSSLTVFAQTPINQWIWLDGRRLFQVTALEGYLPERVQKIESNLEQISNTYFQSSSNDLQVNVVTVNGLPTLEVNGQYLLTITELDAKLLGLDDVTAAEQFSQIIQQALVRGKQERQPQFLQRQSFLTGGIILAVSIGNWFLRKLRFRIKKTTIEVDNPSEITRESSTATKQYQNNFSAIENRLLFYLQIILLLGGILGCLYLFPYTRPLQVWLLSGLEIPLKIGLVSLGIYFAIRFSNVLIDRLVYSITVNPFVSPTTSERAQLRIATIFSAIQWVTIIAWLIIGLIVILIVLEVDIAPLVAGAGLLGVAVSLASQNLIKDTINGFLIVFEDQYGIGDIIDTGTWSGMVEELNLRITQLRNSEGKLITIPNSQIGVVANLTKSWSRVNLDIPIDYNTDIKTAIKIIEGTATEMFEDPQWKWQILETPKMMGIEDFSHRGLMVKVWIKTRPMKQWDIAREYRLRLKLAFDEAGISIAVPQQDISVRTERL